MTKDRPFPWYCIECKESTVVPVEADYSTTIKHDGRSYCVRIPNLPIPTCRKCGDQLFTGEEDRRIRDALRAEIGLMMPQEIQARRAQLGLSQKELAEQVGVAKETISRWETGAIQSRAMDNLLRLYFESEENRRLLRNGFRSVQPEGANRIREYLPKYLGGEEKQRASVKKFELCPERN